MIKYHNYILGDCLVYFCQRKQKSFLKNKKKSLFIVPCFKTTNIPKSIVQDLGIENISNNSYEFFCKPNNINLIPTIREKQYTNRWTWKRRQNFFTNHFRCFFKNRF